MGKYKEIVYHLPEEREVMESLTVMTDNFIESIKLTHPQKYNTFIQEVKTLCSSYHFNEETLMEASKHFNEYIDINHSDKIAKEEFEINFNEEPFNKYDFNFMLNEHHKIYHHHFNDDINKTCEMTLTWLDSNNGKAMKYYKKMYKNE